MKVYVVISNGAMGGYPPEAIFSTRGKAEEYVKKYADQYEERYKGRNSRSFPHHNIEEMELDTEEPNGELLQ